MDLTPLELSAFHAAADLLDPPPPQWATPGALARHLEPSTQQTPALDLIDAELVAAAEGRNDRLIVSMPPQEGKSQRVSRWFPLWLLQRMPHLRVAVISYELGMARRWSRQVRNDIATYSDTLGLSVRSDTSAANEWQLDGHLGGMYAIGIGGALTGRPVDVLIIDDPIKDWKSAQSSGVREDAWDWWTSVGVPRLAPGAVVVLVQTRWHHDDLAGRMLGDSETGREWRELNIPAEADHAEGEVDVLGREPGEFMASARGRTAEMWQRIRRTVGSRVWGALYQGRPSPAEGDVLKRDWWRFYDAPQWVERPDGSRVVLGNDITVVQSWDMAFKDKSDSDFVVGQVWLLRGADVFLLDQVRERMSFTETVRAVVGLSARWPQSSLKLVEDKANGPAVISALARRVPGIVPVEPDGSKAARAQAVAPFVESGNVWLPDPGLGAPWVMDFVEECAGFPNGAHDDQVDTFSQAVNRLLLMPLLAGDRLVEDSELDDYSISTY